MISADSDRLHVAFSLSAGGDLKQAIETLGLDEAVISLADDLSLGPIDPGDARQRQVWAADELSIDEAPDDAERIEAFWRRIESHHGALVAWMSSNDVRESCGLRELSWRVREAAIHIVDVAGLEMTRLDGRAFPGATMSLATVQAEQMVRYDLLARARPLSDVERARHRAEWKALRFENADLRVLTSEGIVSASLSHFDETIRSFVTSEWRRCVDVLTDVLWKAVEGPYRPCMSDVLWFDRLLRMVDDGKLEGRNDQELWDMHESWVRLK